VQISTSLAEQPSRVAVFVLLLVTAAAWWAVLAGNMTAMPAIAPAAGPDAMDSMGMGRIDSQAQVLDGMLTFLAGWAVMMTAMMLPSASPMVLLFDTAVARQVSNAQRWARTGVFALGYLVVWAAFGVPVYLASLALAMWLGSADAALFERWALGGILLFAGVYQFTSFKDVCLKACQSPLGFLMTHWHAGITGALHTSIQHGAYCVACCWAFMAVLVAVGAMSLPWVLAIASLVAVEKLVPAWRATRGVIGVGFIALAIIVVMAPNVVISTRL